jgi:ribosomal protein S18 acetylase RimI-like enzyme
MTLPNLTLRTATLDDLDALAALEEEVFAGEEVQIDRRQWRYLLTDATGEIVVAESAGLLAGALVLGHRRGGKSLRIVSLGVAKHARRRGVARRLLKRTLEYARKHGFELVHLEVRSDNRAARAAYRKFGFVEVSELRDYYGRGKHGLRMELQVTA